MIDKHTDDLLSELESFDYGNSIVPRLVSAIEKPQKLGL